MNKSLQGVVIYGSTTFFKGSSFIDQLYDSTHYQEDSIKLFLDNNVIYGTYHNELFFIYDDVFYAQSKNNLPKFAMFRCGNWHLAEQMERMGIICFPSSYIIHMCLDKALVTSRYTGIVSVPNTLYEKGLRSFETKDYPMFVKASRGSGGKEVFQVYSHSQRDSAEEDIGRDKAMIYQQPMKTGDDLRIFVLGNDIFGSVLRVVPKDKYKANRENNPQVIYYELSDKEKETINRVINSTPTEHGLMSFDFLFDDSGDLVLGEINASPGINFLIPYTDNNIVNLYLDYIYNKII